MGQPTVAVILPIVRLSNRLDTRHTSHEESPTITNLLTPANSFLDMFRHRLEDILNHGHELYRLSGPIEWEVLEREFGKLYSEEGRPSIQIHLRVRLTQALG